MKTLTITVNMMPAPADIGAISGALHKLATDLATLRMVPTVLALRHADGTLMGAASFMFGEEPGA